ncbi:MAG: ABC-F family ATP-binding cassette domain-containing protein [Solirubrobacterales bacterium]|nr:ABC-F family ATP-binding cassette domain-containing protein [Solirubrobacterales bacterium]
MMRNLVNLSRVSKEYAARTILEDVTLGIADGERIGIVGQNGNGKSTLLALIAGSEQPDQGQVVHTGTLTIGRLGQGDDLDGTVEQALGGFSHEWAADAEFRDVLDGLLGGTDRTIRTETLSGGERRRIALAKVLLTKPELLLLDEPTNHLDVQGISWLAAHLKRRKGAMAIITHDRWFLDEVTTHTWEVAERTVHQYEGGYAAYVLARAERERQSAALEAKRQQLLRKELAWLRRGPPARTSKPKFRIEAANTLIEDEPEPRNTTELLSFARQRIGNTVLEAEDLSFRLLKHITWRIGPGDRFALVGVNGSGKTTLLALLAGALEPTGGKLKTGKTVKLAMLSQHSAELAPDRNVLESLADVKQISTLADGTQITAGKLAERFGFRGERLRTKVADLSGGERRRLALMRLLMGEPNVLLLDEPTNDLDIDTLTALEDLLDGWGGTLIVVSHDRYFIERVTDNVYALTPGGGIRHVPGGVDQYLSELTAPVGAASKAAKTRTPGAGGRERAARKELARLEREVEKAAEREAALHEQMAAVSSDHEKLAELTAELNAAVAERQELEERWLAGSEALEA